MGDSYPKVRVGVVQAASVFLDREACVEKAVGYIEEAGRQQISLLAFPEGFIPAHPIWYHFMPATGRKSVTLATELFKNSVEIPGPVTDALCAAAARARTHVVIGVCEKRPRTTGTLFNTQLFIDPAGRILGKHQKIMPTTGERIVHTGGYGDTLRAFDTEIGIVSGLLCAENSNPLAIFALAAQGTQIHVASWPNHFSQHRMGDVIAFTSRSLAYKCGCFVLNAVGTISDRMREILPYRDEDRAFLADPENGGGACIIGANAMILAGPMSGVQEGILSADINLEDCLRAKAIHDYTGHYNRADIFRLTVNTAVPSIYETVEEAPSLVSPLEETRSHTDDARAPATADS